ncbi:MAG: ATP-binding protein, partial [Verrucomicrobiota bacterium]
MEPKAQTAKALFLRQAMWIALPVVALAVFCLYYLYQDWATAEIEARGRAQQIAGVWAQTLQSEWELSGQPANIPPILTVDSFRTRHGFHLTVCDKRARLITPAALDNCPTPSPLDVTQLDPAQTTLWRAAEEAELREDSVSAGKALEQFLNAKPPPRFSENAEYLLGHVLAKAGDNTSAAQYFARLASGGTSRCSEAGSSLSHLAALQLFSTNGIAGAVGLDFQAICSNAVVNPSPYSERILNLVHREEQRRGIREGAAFHWKTRWNIDQRFRAIYRQSEDVIRRALSSNPVPPAIPVTDGQTPQLLLRLSPGRAAETFSFFCVPEGNGLETFLVRHRSTLRELLGPFGITIEIAGRTAYANSLSVTEMKLGGPISQWNDRAGLPIFGAAEVTIAGQPAARVRIHLGRDGSYFRQLKQRSVLLSSLVAFATLAALISLRSAYLTFRQQQQLGEMKSNFVSAVSHELRAPIASVRLMAENLERGKIAEPHKQREYFGFIVQECRRLSALIENVLDFARIEQGRKQFEFEPTDVGALAQQTVKLMEPYAMEHKINVRAEPVALDLQPLLDGAAIQQALVNLIDNAIKFSPAGSTVTVDLEERDTTLRLSVEDRGCGIPPEDHERIFERFYRRGTEMRRESQGVGIGLSLVKH